MDHEPEKRRHLGKKAVALRYDMDTDSAPKVIAKGDRLLAERIIEVAKEHDIHVHEDPDLVAVLGKLDVNAEIPEELYRVVAEVLAFVYRVNEKLRVRKMQGTQGKS